METDFSLWLMAELNKRGWNSSELAKRSGISSGAISKVLSLARSPGLTFCKGVARALGIPESEVLRAAGLISVSPAMGELTEVEHQLIGDFRHLDDKGKVILTVFAKTLRKLQDGETEVQ